jgi:hypothetical protein
MGRKEYWLKIIDEFSGLSGQEKMHYGQKTNVDGNHQPYGPKKGAQASIAVR